MADQVKGQDFISNQPPAYNQATGQPQAYPELYQAGTSAPITGQPQAGNTMIAPSDLGPHPYPSTCGNCGSQIITETSPVTGAVTWVSAYVIAGLGGLLCCLCFVPFYTDRLKDVEHRCPNCKLYLGVYKRMC